MVSRPRYATPKWTLLYLSTLLSSSVTFAQIREPNDDDWQEHTDRNNNQLGDSDDNDESLFFQLTTPQHYPQAIDFRDLLLPPNEAASLGGTGLQPYGNLISSSLWPFMDDLSEPDKGNFINQQVIEPFTAAQSGVNGSLYYTEEDVSFGFQYSTNGLGDLSIQVSDIRIQNLNTFLPITMMHPTREPHVLINQFTLGTNNSANTDSKEEALKVSLRLSIAIEGDTPMAMQNVVDLHFSVPSSSFLFELVVLIDRNKFLRLPIADIMDPACWVNTLLHTLAEDPLHRPVHLQQFQAELTSLLVDVSCVACSSLMESFLPQLTSSIRTSTSSHISTLALSMGGFVEDAVWNMWEALDMTRTIQEVSTYCPNHPDYNAPGQPLGDLSGIDGVVVELGEDNITVAAVESFALNLYLNLNGEQAGSPKLSKSSFESTLALGMLSIQTVLIIASQKYLALEALPPPPPPLQRQPDDNMDHILDWREYDEPMDAFREYWTPERTNGLLHDTFLLGENNTGLEIPLPDNTTFDTTLGHLVGINSIRVTGLDTLSKLNVLEVLGPYELGTELQFENLGVEAHLSFLTSSEFPGNNPILEPQNMTAFFQLRDVRVFGRMMLQIDLEQLGNLQMWTLLQDFNKSIPCLLAGAKNTSIVDLRVTVGAMDPPSVNGYLSSELESMLNSVSRDLNQNHGQDIVDAVPNFFQVTVRNLVNEFLTEELQRLNDNSTVCVLQNASRWDDFVDFRGLFLAEGGSPYGTFLTTVYSFLKESFFNAEGVKRINDRVAVLTEEQSFVKGSLNLTENGANITTRIQIGNVDIEAEFHLWNMSLLNLDSLGMPFRLLYPEDSYKLDSNFSVGAGSKPVTFVARMLLKASDGEEMDIHNDLNLRFSLDTLALYARILLKMRELTFLTFPLKSMPVSYCWLALMPPQRASIVNSTAQNMSGVSLSNFEWKYDNATIDLNCTEPTSCTSPRLPELFETLYKRGEDEYDQIEGLITRLLEGSAVQSIFGRMLDSAPSYCPHSEEYDPEKAATVPDFLAGLAPEATESIESKRDGNAVYLNIFFICTSVGVLLCFAVSRTIIHFKNKDWTESLSSEGRKLLDQFEEKEQERDDYVDQTTASLFHSLYIPVLARYLVPIVLLVDIALFAVTHTAISISIAVDVNLAGDDFTIDRIFEFRFLDGIQSAYDNGGYEFAILLLVFGVIWPYVRCLLSLILWFTPPRWLSATHRGTMLLWIDAMNKLTVRDIIKFMVIISIGFIFFGGPFIFSNAAGDLYGMRIIAVPGPAIYCGISAMIISRVSAVMLLQYHDMALTAVRKEYHLDQLDPTSFGLVDTTQRGDDLEHSEHSLNSEDSFTIPAEISIPIPGGRYINICGKRILLGNLGIALAGLVVVSVALVALIFVPAVSIDLSAILELIVESGTTYEEAISQFGVYAFVCAVLIKARLVMESTLDYVAIACFLAVGIFAIYFKVVIQFTRWIRSIYKHGWRQTFPIFFEKDPEVVKIPAYLKLHAHRRSTCWTVAYSIGLFQLGAVTIYAINNFCNMLDTIWDSLAFAGLVPPTSGKCWEAQMAQSHNLIVFISCFAYLTFCFVLQLTVQYKTNVRKASISLRYQQEETAFLERLGDAWKRSGHKGTRPCRRSIPDSSRSRVFTITTDFEDDDSDEDSEAEFASSLSLVPGAPMMEVVPVDEYLREDRSEGSIPDTRYTLSSMATGSSDQALVTAEDDQEAVASIVRIESVESIDVDDIGGSSDEIEV